MVEGCLVKNEKKINLKKSWSNFKFFSCHQNTINAIDFNKNGSLFATGASDKIIKIWHSKNHIQLATMKGHVEKISCLFFDQKYPLLFSGSGDLSIKCWDIEYNKVLKNYAGHSGPITNLAFHPSMNIFFSSSEDNTVRIWDTRLPKIIRILNFHKKPVSSIIASSESPHLISGCTDGKVLFWDFISGKRLGCLKSNKFGIRQFFDFKKEFLFSILTSDSIYILRKDGRILKKIKDIKSKNKFFEFDKKKNCIVCSDQNSFKTIDSKKKKEMIKFSFDPEGIPGKNSRIYPSVMKFGKNKKNLFIGDESGSMIIFRKKWKVDH